MAFLKGVKSTIDIPVTIALVVVNDDDREELVELNPIVTFTRFKRSAAREIQVEVAKLGRDASEAMESGDLTSILNNRLGMFDDLLKKHVLNWRKMPGPDDEDVEFSKEALEEAIEDSFYFAGLMTGLRKALGWETTELAEGSVEVERKN